MKLYYSPGACSLASHIIALEAGLNPLLVSVDVATHRTQHGVDYRRINPKGCVPLLELDDGQHLSEGAAILQYLADLRPQAQLIPAAGTLARYRVQEMLNFIATEIHQAYLPLFRGEGDADARDRIWRHLFARLLIIENGLGDRQHLCEPGFGVADAYLFVMLCWATKLGFDLSAFPRLQALMGRTAMRPQVARALQAEGLLPAPATVAA